MLSNSSSYTERIDQKFAGYLPTSYTRKNLPASGVRQGRKVVILQEKYQDSILEAFD